MTEAGDPRLTLARRGLASAASEGWFVAEHYRPTVAMSPRAGAAAMRARADAQAEQCDELVFGEVFEVLDVEDGWAFGQASRDGYVGWVEAAALVPARVDPPSHWVRAPRTVALAEPSARAAALLPLPMNALVRVEAEADRFARVAGAGWVARSHLAGFAEFEPDPAAVASRFAGAPYQWGGRGLVGIDCSGLVQAALFACGHGCPRDSDQQAGLGEPVERADLRRNDLACWPGHIGLMLDGERLIHASGLQMAVVTEPLEDALAARPGPARFVRPRLGP